MITMANDTLLLQMILPCNMKVMKNKIKNKEFYDVVG